MTVHVRIAELNLREAALRRCRAVLDAREQERAQGYADERARRRFVAARGLLRFTLAAATGGSAAALSFAYGPFGKPYLSENGKPHPLKFSLAHAGNFAALAWSDSGEVGIDIEVPRTEVKDDLDSLIAHVLSGSEQKRLRRLAPAARESAFYRLWTRKEALAKALGAGFSIAPAEIAAVEQNWRGFRVRELKLRPGLFGALACS